ncbi:hypothetical protein [Acinetobacter seifertii]|uniref:hypothetical protein n=1 Tax=Acinetobacter seifertii TaxID=1530123 RepID=UPI001C0A5266|nr:hypothetical protein [Acinetobacter seifertii]
MAVPEQTPYKEYTANGITTVFSLDFDVLEQDHLIVLINDLEPIVGSWHFDSVNDSVVFNIAPEAGSIIKIRRDTPLSRTTNYQLYDRSFLPEPVNNDFDKIWLKLQEIGVTNWLTDTDIKNLSVYVNSLNDETRDEFYNNLGNLEKSIKAMLDEAIKNGAVSALAITTVDTVEELEDLNAWEGRTVSVTSIGNYKYKSSTQTWERDFITDRQVVTVDTLDELFNLNKWEGRTIYVKNEGFFSVLGGLWKSLQLESIYSKFKFTTVHNALNRLKTYSDYGYDKQALGFNDSAFAAMFNDAENDNDIFLPARLSLSSGLHGTGNNATLLSLLGNNGKSFKAQIVAGDTKLLSQYNMSEDVLIYAGVTGRTTTSTSNPIFTNNTITITDQADLSTVQVGTIIKTSDGYWGHVSKVEDEKLTVLNWYRIGIQGTPIGASASLNHIDKVYLANKVIWCPSSFTGSKIVGEEWDFMNSSLNAGERTGLDMVVHDSSTKDMDTAHLVRSGKYGVAWLTAFQSQGAKYAGFLNADGVSGQTASLAGFAEVSTAQVGMYFNGGNALAFKFRYSPSSNVYPTLINTYGFQIKSGNVTKSAINDQVIDMNAKSYYVNNVSNTFSLVLPDSELVAGQQLEFLLFGDKEVIAKCINQSITVNNLQAYSYIPSVFYKRIIAVWNGSGWYVFS